MAEGVSVHANDAGGTGCSDHAGSLLEEIDRLISNRHLQLRETLETHMARYEELLLRLPSRISINTDGRNLSQPGLSSSMAGYGKDSSIAGVAHIDSNPSLQKSHSDAYNRVAQQLEKSQTQNLRCSHNSTFSQEMRSERLKNLGIWGAGTTGSSFNMGETMRRTWQWFINSDTFDMTICVIIIANVVFFGVQAEHRAQTLQQTPPTAMKAVAWAFTAFFVLELLLRILTQSCGTFFRSAEWRWNILDTVIVILSLVDFIMDLQSEGSAKLSHVRAVRITRMVRLLRILRIMKHCRSLRILIFSVLNMLRSVMWILVLLTMILYFFAVVFLQSTTQYRLDRQGADVDPELVERFGTLWKSVLTLFMCITGGVDWRVASDPLGQIHWGMTFLFIVFIAFVHFAVLNVVTSCFCQSAIESASLDQDMVIQAQLAQKNKYIERLKALFKSMDPQNTGHISLAEFEASMEEEWFKAYFDSMEITVVEAFSLFKLLDTRCEYRLDIDTFVTGCLRLRGSARSVDIAMMVYESRWTMHRFMELLRDFKHDFEGLEHGLCKKGLLEKERKPSPGSKSRQKIVPRASFLAMEDLAVSRRRSAASRGSSRSRRPRSRVSSGRSSGSHRSKGSTVTSKPQGDDPLSLDYSL